MELTFDEAEAIGLDGTGRDLDPRFPHTYHDLTDEEKTRFWQYRIMGTEQLVTRGHVDQFVAQLRELSQAFGRLEYEWHILDLPGDFIVPEFGLPISVSVEETGAEIWVLSERIDAAADEVFGYVGAHRYG